MRREMRTSVMPSKGLATTAGIISALFLLNLSSCSRFASEPMELYIAFTNEVKGYIEPCG